MRLPLIAGTVLVTLGCGSGVKTSPGTSTDTSGTVAPGGGGTGGGTGGTGSSPGSGTSTASASVPTTRTVFPADNPWNQDITASPVDPASTALITSCGGAAGLHPDFGTVYNGAPNGIPYVLVTAAQAKVPVTFEYTGESDPGPYPIPPDAPIEGGPSSTGDRHVLVVDTDAWKLYELYNAKTADGGATWHAGSGAIYDLASDALRPEGWTSADAAGLPIFPGLVRYDEVVGAKKVAHAFRFTCDKTRAGYVAPARHFASSNTDAGLPPMGMRMRLKAGFDTSKFPASVQPILTALKTYGMILADNGSNLFVSGAPDSRWSDGDLSALKGVHGTDFEVVQMGAVGTKTGP